MNLKRRPTIVVADTNDGIREGIAIILNAFGFRVLKAATMMEAAELILKHDPDLVLTDDCLSDGDGCELCRQFKVNGFYRALPFIMWAGHEVPTERLNNAGIDLFLWKPVSPEFLLQRMNALIANYDSYRKSLRLSRPRRSSPRNSTPFVFSITRVSRVEL